MGGEFRRLARDPPWKTRGVGQVAVRNTAFRPSAQTGAPFVIRPHQLASSILIQSRCDPRGMLAVFATMPPIPHGIGETRFESCRCAYLAERHQVCGLLVIPVNQLASPAWLGWQLWTDIQIGEM